MTPNCGASDGAKPAALPETLVLSITPAMRVQLMHAERIQIELPPELSNLADQNRRLREELDSYKQGKVHPRMKAGCIGEFELSVETVCPHCYAGEPDDDCEVCHGATEYTVRHVIPWDTQKDIFRAMCKFKAEGDQA